MMIYLGIDYGEARVGLALSDALGLVARPLETLEPAPGEPKPRVAQLIADKAVSLGARTVVLGLPLHMNGSEGKAAAKVRAFGDLLRARLPESVGLVYVDERLSTVEATARLHRKGKRPEKPAVDRMAAAVILQDWLDQQAGAGACLLPPPEPGEPPRG